VRGTLHHWAVGAGDPLLLVSGFALPAAVLEPVVAPFAQHYQCITFDHRGSGASRGRVLPMTTARMAADAVRVLDALGLESAAVYGLSLGGMVAQEMAIRFPDRVRGLILGATSPGGLSAVWPDSGTVLSSIFANTGGLGRGTVTHPLGAWAQAWAATLHDSGSRLGRIRAPTLVLHGDCDGLVPVGNARLLARRIPRAELVILAGEGHFFAFEQAEAVADIVMDWLDTSAAVSGSQPLLRRTIEPVSRAVALPIGLARTTLLSVRGVTTLAALAKRRSAPHPSRRGPETWLNRPTVRSAMDEMTWRRRTCSGRLGRHQKSPEATAWRSSHTFDSMLAVLNLSRCRPRT
jgi:3-oxoadipate enol-lactonase